MKICSMRMRIIYSIAIAMLVFISCTTNVYAAEMESNPYTWHFLYEGTSKQFQVPFTGKYSFLLTGAQGSNTSQEGGLGGQLSVTIYLKRNDIVQVNIGGQNGYGGGGTGTDSNGGGATTLYVNGNIVAIAGGGGGATLVNPGECGGELETNTREPNFLGSSSDESGSAGGGGGYVGGSCGRFATEIETQKIVYYWSVTQPSVVDGLLCGVLMDNINYIYCESPARCSEKKYSIVDSAPYDASAIGYSVGFRYDYLTLCGHKHDHHWTKASSYGYPDQNNQSVITKELTMEYNSQAEGGSSWIDTSVCSLGNVSSGVQRGNGEITIILLEVNELYYVGKNDIRIFYCNEQVKKVFFNSGLIKQSE